MARCKACGRGAAVRQGSPFPADQREAFGTIKRETKDLTRYKELFLQPGRGGQVNGLDEKRQPGFY